MNTGVFRTDLYDVLSKWYQALQQEVPQATKPYVSLQINQLELQVQKEEEEAEEMKEKEV